MRKVRVDIVGGAVPTLVGTLLAPACGERSGLDDDRTVTAYRLPEAGPDARDSEVVFNPDTSMSEPDTSPGPFCSSGGEVTQTFVVPLPPPGTPADQAQICAISSPPVSSNVSARFIISDYSSQNETAKGLIAIDPAVFKLIVGPPKITVVSASDPTFSTLQVVNITKVPNNYILDLKWAGPLPHSEFGGSMVVKTGFFIDCGNGKSQWVEAITNIVFCVNIGTNTFEWVSEGNLCTICTVIAEMAPSPIVSDNTGDDLPLGRVVRVRVVEVARAGKQVLLFAENDAGEDLQVEWRVSGGSLEKIDDDVMLWTMPDDPHAFGQVAAWSDVGAGVENFFAGYA
jgi:hypothetical protein